MKAKKALFPLAIFLAILSTQAQQSQIFGPAFGTGIVREISHNGRYVVDQVAGAEQCSVIDVADYHEFLCISANGKYAGFRGDHPNHSIDTRNWDKGVYLIKIATKDGESVHKIIKN